jgi:putative spermidine/putrescine transport system permease protein
MRLRTAAFPYLLTAPLLLFLLLAYIVPFLGVVRWSVTLPEPGFSQYRRLATDPLALSVLLRTLRICTLVTVAATLGAYAIAYVWVRGTPVQRRLAELCILIPFWISVLTRAFGWLALLSNRGLVNTWLQQLGVIAEPLTLVRNEFGVIVGMTHFLIPFAVFPIASSMRSVDGRVLLAARGLGGSQLRIFWRIFVPMTFPGIIGAALIVFVFALGFFVTPAILGGGHSIMVAELVYLHMFQSPDWGLGAAISVALVVAVGLLLALLFRFVRPGALRSAR